MMVSVMSFDFDQYQPDSAFIKTVWRTRSVQAASFISQAESRWEMVVVKQQGKPTFTLKGAETRAKVAPVPADAEFVGIQFHHGCFMPHFPMHELTNGGFNLDNASDRRFWLRGSAFAFPDFEDAELFIDRLVKTGEVVKDPLVKAVLDDEPVDTSLRTVQRRFVKVMGLTPNALKQIERARQAAHLLETGNAIADVSFDMGYADQSHLTRSLKTLMGQTPAQLRDGVK